MTLFADRHEKPKNKTKLKRPARYGVVMCLVSYIILALFFGGIGNTFLVAFLATLPPDFGGFILTCVISVVPCTLIALLVCGDQQPLKGLFGETVSALTLIGAIVATCLMAAALYNTIDFIAKIPPDAVFREYSDSYIGLVRLWFVSIGLDFFFGLGVWSWGIFSRKEPELPMHEAKDKP